MYQVTWTIEVEAESAREAAQIALGIQRDATSIATVFDVEDLEDLNCTVTIDLGEEAAQ